MEQHAKMDSRAKRRLKHRSGADLISTLSSDFVRAVIPGIGELPFAELDIDVTDRTEEPNATVVSNARRLKTFGLSVGFY